MQWIRKLKTVEEKTLVAVDSKGNAYLTGSTASSIGGPNRGGWDAWVAKYDADGQLLWKQQLGTKEDDSSNGVAVDSQDNVYLTGSTSGSLGGSQQGNGDAWVAKYDADGQLLWKQQLGTSESEFSNDVAVDSQDNVYLTGTTTGSLGGSQQGNGDAWVAKYAPDGQLLWKQQLGTSNEDEGIALAVNEDNVYLLAYHPVDRTGGWRVWYTDELVVKYNSQGQLQWKRRLAISQEDHGYDIAVDRKENVYTTGETGDSLGGPNRGGWDAWLAKNKFRRW